LYHELKIYLINKNNHLQTSQVFIFLIVGEGGLNQDVGALNFDISYFGYLSQIKKDLFYSKGSK